MKSIVVMLQGKAIIFTSQKDLPESETELAGFKFASPSESPWPVMPDLLVHSDSATVIGVALEVNRERSREIRALCSKLNPDVVRYKDLSDYKDLEFYSHNQKADWVEIRWGRKLPDTFQRAQLLGGYWYYNLQTNRRQAELIAFGIAGFGDDLAPLDLRIPPSEDLKCELRELE